MTNSLYFCDSNIWLYRLLIDPECNDAAERRKRNLAAALTSRENILISTQIINEVCAVLSKKAKISEVQIRQIIQEFYDGCLVIQLDRNIILRASDWDSLIVASALASEANILYSEDMQDGLIISNQLTLINPFRAS
ncbi:MAG: PIN domain nuclease [Microcystis aeruginosa Ma_QC_Ch_20071001_S25]|jgi:predicted nucleic acid-binding protein|uniref:PIN domain nuclease n=1 Tax=Microcystis aeruginosa Ma_QC_Ch_20071001_S25D TaxID=2486250 RepID=A0A552FVJ5_MICAE|nr:MULTISPECIES: PIN domain-containing protein [unclassified Microcystis]MCA2762018.1 PIN domain-containing protein [Microcystis sp. M151S2]TRU50725.1 MAG: PIN domain nuclease [Microcystis aeruginosa Ma_QC_Ch_20071001_S25D]TRU52682.1 MAG: PIN domain nuclease [Microcystis aeruginosa Ma_QC_Ch_20071001_S25]TRU66232.1 MAG: PIN domain nuclease [Microcystis aeruginosa Ma_QC_Ch_20071001_M135]MCA2642304.1 PIN domain-containing protein [Microcystis sp. M087S2]